MSGKALFEGLANKSVSSPEKETPDGCRRVAGQLHQAATLPALIKTQGFELSVTREIALAKRSVEARYGASKKSALVCSLHLRPRISWPAAFTMRAALPRIFARGRGMRPCRCAQLVLPA